MSISLSSRRRLSLIALLILWGLIAAPSSADLPIDPAGSIERSTEPVILTGNQFPQWSAGPEISVREPQASNDVQCDGDVDCSRFDQEISRVRTSDCKKGSGEYSDSKDHNCYQEPRLRIAGIKEGAAVTSLLAFKWNGNGFTEIPFQVDERFTRYITNNNSGFAFYSGADKHTTYAYDREGWRFTTNDDSSLVSQSPEMDRQQPPIQLLDSTTTTSWPSCTQTPQHKPRPMLRFPPGSLVPTKFESQTLLAAQ